jgi:7-keto-8-aminopelargonate synthetase-like enzyme
VDLKLRYKFRVILDETWSYGVLGRAGRGLTEHQNIDPLDVDMIIGSLAGPLCAGGGFCAGVDEVTEHQRLSASAFTYSAALPAIFAKTASETINMLQSQPELIGQSREATRTMWQQLDPRSDWVCCTSAPENPMMLLSLKPEVAAARRLSAADQEAILQEAVDEVRWTHP